MSLSSHPLFIIKKPNTGGKKKHVLVSTKTASPRKQKSGGQKDKGKIGAGGKGLDEVEDDDGHANTNGGDKNDETFNDRLTTKGATIGSGSASKGKRIGVGGNARGLAKPMARSTAAKKTAIEAGVTSSSSNGGGGAKRKRAWSSKAVEEDEEQEEEGEEEKEGGRLVDNWDSTQAAAGTANCELDSMSGQPAVGGDAGDGDGDCGGDGSGKRKKVWASKAIEEDEEDDDDSDSGDETGGAGNGRDGLSRWQGRPHPDEAYLEPDEDMVAWSADKKRSTAGAAKGAVSGRHNNRGGNRKGKVKGAGSNCGNKGSLIKKRRSTTTQRKRKEVPAPSPSPPRQPSKVPAVPSPPLPEAVLDAADDLPSSAVDRDSSASTGRVLGSKKGFKNGGNKKGRRKDREDRGVGSDGGELIEELGHGFVEKRLSKQVDEDNEDAGRTVVGLKKVSVDTHLRTIKNMCLCFCMFLIVLLSTEFDRYYPHVLKKKIMRILWET